MADAKDSKSFGGDFVWVRVPPSALERAAGINLQLFLYLVINQSLFMEMHYE